MKGKPLLPLLPLLLLSLMGCTKTLPPPHTVSLNIHTIALLPPQFPNQKPDTACHPDIGRNVRYWIGQVLKGKGYRILFVGAAENAQLSAAAGNDLTRLAALAPPQADAVLAVRVVDYLDAGLCDRENPSLSMRATARLIRRTPPQVLWSGTGSASDVAAGGPLRVLDPADVVTSDLARQLLSSLPIAASPR